MVEGGAIKCECSDNNYFAGNVFFHKNLGDISIEDVAMLKPKN